VVVSQPAPAQLSPGTVLFVSLRNHSLLGKVAWEPCTRPAIVELERQVALKVIRADMVASPEILKRFKQELILARQITHKNVIRIFDLGEADGSSFITMEYIEGEDLAEHSSPQEKARAGRGSQHHCSGQQGTGSCPCRRRNSSRPQAPKHHVGQERQSLRHGLWIARSEMASGVTQAGVLIGTPDYMSPETSKGLPLDARSDLFTVGIIFYEILSGRIPFESDTTMGKLMEAHERTGSASRRTRPDDSAGPL